MGWCLDACYRKKQSQDDPCLPFAHWAEMISFWSENQGNLSFMTLFITPLYDQEPIHLDLKVMKWQTPKLQFRRVSSFYVVEHHDECAEKQG